MRDTREGDDTVVHGVTPPSDDHRHRDEPHERPEGSVVDTPLDVDDLRHHPEPDDDDSPATGYTDAVVRSDPETADPEEVANRWRDIQLTFVDRPQQAAEMARELVDEAVRSRIAAITTRQAELDGWSLTTADTELMRQAVQRYRDFFHRMLTH
ncbi:hypothetical protein LX16_1055 [Stackebrandtia albiflava]|uniref:Uncharacterized protein n=1 Tax=Stackebrandtia albiflava TaxID=406432 RepID=A0A562VBT8_9ACTN|nr:hypothetical protein [Stackebrandtia albiflava]TWJ15354.1 hypothetical protein LX16_1055 [Stackebrandtia albiflava]